MSRLTKLPQFGPKYAPYICEVRQRWGISLAHGRVDIYSFLLFLALPRPPSILSASSPLLSSPSSSSLVLPSFSCGLPSLGPFPFPPFPFFTLTPAPNLFSPLVKPVLALMPGKSFAEKTWKTSLVTEDTTSVLPPRRVISEPRRMSVKCKRYGPGVRQDKSGKMKKQEGGWLELFASDPMIEEPAFESGSAPTNGEATSVPINRRVVRCVEGSLIAVTSVLGLSEDRRVQWTTLKGYRSSDSSDGELGSKSARVSWTIGGGSITRRSRSPKPQARAARGCWRTESL